MPRKPTGNPTGRPVGSGTLGLSDHVAHARVTLRVSNELYARLEAFAAGRSYTRGTPQLAACIRALLEHALACPYKRQTGRDTFKQTEQRAGTGEDTQCQTESTTPLMADASWQIGSGALRQTSQSIASDEDTQCQTESTPSLRESTFPPASVAMAPQPVAPAPPVVPVSPLSDKAAVLAQLDAWKADGLSLQAMADRLDAMHIMTFRGKLGWSKGTIGNLLAKRQAQAVA